jgi:hydrogenase nickel incorporation protein HypB
MCGTCGCDDEGGGATGGGVRLSVPHHEHLHPHPHPHGHGETVVLEQKVLAKNESLAESNRDWLVDRGIVAVNLMSSPGAGKTTLLERTIRDLSGRHPVAVVEGDQETLLDAERIGRTGCAVVQVNTGAGCHLDAQMMQGALAARASAAGSWSSRSPRAPTSR